MGKTERVQTNPGHRALRTVLHSGTASTRAEILRAIIVHLGTCSARGQRLVFLVTTLCQVSRYTSPASPHSRERERERHTDTQTYGRTQTHTCIHRHSHIHAHTHKHKYKHKYTHAYRERSSWSLFSEKSRTGIPHNKTIRQHSTTVGPVKDWLTDCGR